MRKLTALLLLALLAAPLPAPAAPATAGSQKPVFTLYTAMTATTPQVPLWSAIRQGWPQGYELRIEYWKNLDDLRGSILADKGDLWVGHLEGFAQAARRGAPITLVAVTAWRKFWCVAADKEAADAALALQDDEKPGRGPGQPAVSKALAAYLAEHKIPLAVVPQDSPAIPVLEDFAKYGLEFQLAPMAPQPLMLEITRGTRKYAILPEPFVSVLKSRVPDLQILANLEDEYGCLKGGDPGLPLVGIAVHRRLAEENPKLVEELLRLMQEAVTLYTDRPEAAAALLPQEVRDTLSHAALVSSIINDTVRMTPAGEARARIFNFLALALSPEDAQYLESLGGQFIFNGAADQ
jgi:NitT/TauT family transport system substrate-binding protein